MKGNFDAVVFGATGMIGSFLIKILSNDHSGSKILVFNRTIRKYGNERIIQQQMPTNLLGVHYDELSFNNCYICLGTTMKKAGSKEAFIKIDRDLILECATFAKNHQTQNIFLVSAVGAERESNIFYNQVKGMTEDGIMDLKFVGTHIFRPSLLIGDRKESRLAESMSIQLARLIDPIMGGLLGKYRAIQAENVAKSMYLISKRNNNTGVHYYHYKEIQASIKI